MLKPDDRHLSEEEIDQLAGSLSADDSTSAQGRSSSEAAAQHLSSCQECQRQISRRKVANGRLKALKSDWGNAGSNCPSDGEWMNVAAGIADATRSNQLLDHASSCDCCGAKLKIACALLSEDIKAEESNRLAGLDSAKPDWQKKLIDRLVINETCAPQSDSTRASDENRFFASGWWRGLSFGWRLAVPTVVAVVLSIAAWFEFRSTPIAEVNGLIAEAYSERRLAEVRVAGAKFAPIGADRGEENEPQALKDANSLIGHKLISNPEDPTWLDAKGRAELIALHYDAAIETLSRAVKLKPESGQIMTDLATALYLRASANPERKIDYGTAIDYFTRALAKMPDDPIALYNRALANSAMHLYEPAMEDWQHYLMIDPSGEWSSEVRRKLDEVQEKVKKKQSSLQDPLIAPGDVGKDVSSTELEQKLESRVEDYLQLSSKEWLPRAFPEHREGSAPGSVRELLEALARVARKKHDDYWLTDVLDAGHKPDFNSAVSHLAAATKANETGDYAGARREAHQARKLFRSAGSVAGELKAETDEIYSYHLLYDGRHCVQFARELTRRLASHKYRWLEAQATLEAANCDYLTGDFGNARAALDRGTSAAKNANYIGLYLRGLGFQADSAASIGDPRKGFALASSGLELFWSGRGDLMKGYNLYTALDTAADDLRLPNLQLAIWHQATSLIDLHPDLVQRAMAHRWFGNSAYLANRNDIAEREFATASRLFGESPQTEATARGQMDAEIWLAGLEARKGDFARADARLDGVRNRLVSAPSFATEIGYYTTRADLCLRRNDPQATEVSLRSAVFLAEWGLNSLVTSEDRREWVSQTDRTYRTLVWWKIHQGDSTGALELWEWYKGAEYRIPKLGSSPNSGLNSSAPPDASQAPPVAVPTAVADQLQRLRGKSVVTYVLFPDGLAAWIYDDRGIFFHWVPSSGLEALVAGFERLCSTRGSKLNELRSAGHSLYELLITPLEGDMQQDRALAFELDATLSAIPMEALVDKTGHYLIEKTVLTITPGLYQSLHLRSESAVTAASRALVVSVPVTADEGFPPLLDAESEAESVASSFNSAKWLKGSSATLSEVRRDLTKSAVFHFAGHAVALPERSGLLLAEHDPQTQRAVFIGADSLTTDNLKQLQLAVLSACHTWPAAESMTSGTEDLTKSLLRAGVPHVIASRWRVDSTQTSQLMRQFYGQLLTGTDIPSALRSAQLKLAFEPASSHPFYWAAFGVQGGF